MITTQKQIPPHWRTKKQLADMQQRGSVKPPRSKIGKHIYRMRNKAFKKDKDGNFIHNHFIYVSLRHAFTYKKEITTTTKVTILIYMLLYAATKVIYTPVLFFNLDHSTVTKKTDEDYFRMLQEENGNVVHFNLSWNRKTFGYWNYTSSKPNKLKLYNTAIIFFHNLGQTLAGIGNYWGADIEDANIFVIEYCGYPRTTGNASEGAYYESAQKAFQYVAETYDQIILLGDSLGCAMALYVAHQNRNNTKIKKTILLGPFESIARALTGSTLARFPFVSSFDIFKNYKYIKDIKNCIIVHGKKDSTVPYSNALKLKAANPNGVELITSKEIGHIGLHLFRFLLEYKNGNRNEGTPEMNDIIWYGKRNKHKIQSILTPPKT